MRSSSTAEVCKVIGSKPIQPADMRFTEDSFYKMIELLKKDEIVKFLNLHNEDLNEHLTEMGIRNDAAKLFVLLDTIKKTVNREAVVEFLKKHPDYFSQITNSSDICSTIGKVLVLINIGTFHNVNEDIPTMQAQNAANAQVVLNLFQPQLQSFEDYDALSKLLHGLDFNKGRTIEFSTPMMNGSIALCVTSMLGAIKSVPKLEEALVLIPDSATRLDIYSKWKSYWRERNTCEIQSNSEPTPTIVRP